MQADTGGGLRLCDLQGEAWEGPTRQNIVQVSSSSCSGVESVANGSFTACDWCRIWSPSCSSCMRLPEPSEGVGLTWSARRERMRKPSTSRAISALAPRRCGRFPCWDLGTGLMLVQVSCVFKGTRTCSSSVAAASWRCAHIW